MSLRVANNVLELIGNTPIVRLAKIDKDYPFEIWAKCEFMNPTGSVKDRMAYYIIKEAEKQGKLKPGMTILVPTTGNTGIAFAGLGAYLGYRIVIVMPVEMSYERKLLDMLYGAELIYTPGGESDAMGALEYARKLAKENPDKYFVAEQWDDEANVKGHYETTGKEIIEQLDPKEIRLFTAGIGTGGTLVGVGKRLKEANPNIKVVAMEPAECPTAAYWFWKKGKAWGRHEIEGIGDGFVPVIIRNHIDVIDDFVLVSSDEAVEMARKIARLEGLAIGISSGANVVAAIKAAEKFNIKDGKVVTVLPDYAARYFSTRLFLKRRLTPEEHRKMLELARTD